MRPVLRPGLRLLRDAADRAVLVEHDRVYPLDHVTALLLSRLDGTADEPTVLGDGADTATRATWARLRDTGVVVDVEAPAALVRGLDQALRPGALADATALVAHDPHTAEDRWRRRRGATVTVAGRGVLGEALVGLLEPAGLGGIVRVDGTGHAGRPACRGPEVTVLTDDHEPPADVVEVLMREDGAHLVAGMRGPVAIVGPFVLPGTTPCLRCVDLTRCERDPAWAAVRDRLSTPARGTGTAAPASPVVAGAAAALAAAEVLAHVDGRRTATAGATASLSLLDPWPTLRPWPMHPACGCAWHTFSAARGQWGA